MSFEELLENLEAAKGDVVQGYAGNKAAQTRARKRLLEVKKLADTVRKELIAVRKGEIPARDVTLSEE